MNEPGYLLDNRAAEAANRFAGISSIFDPATFRHFEALGVRSGFRCWEVGAGGPTVVRWLAERAGATGRVLATDIDVSLVESAASPTVEVRVHDVGLDEPPAEQFDVVHARLVLVHLPNRDRALAAMARAVRPGGVLFVEDADPALQSLACLDEFGAEQRLANKLRAGFRVLLKERGVELAYGRTLPRRLREAGLVDVSADVHFPIAHPACAPLEAATIRQVRDHLLERGLATPDEIDTHLTNLSAGRLDIVTSPMISAWGKRVD